MWTWFNQMAARIRALFRAGDDDRDFGLELESHLSMLTEDKIRSGMTAGEARREARLELGGVAQLQQAHRDIRLFPFVDTLLQDARYGLTMLRRNPGFTIVAVLTLALGIGATTAIFSVVNAVLLRPLPYRDPDRLVLLSHYQEHDSTVDADFLEWRDQAKSFEQIAAYVIGMADITGNGEAERVAAGVVSSDLFALLGITPALGRTFTPTEDMEGGPPVVILSDSLWRRRFGGDPQVIGRAITVRNQSRTVIGIMPPGFRFPGESDLWLPLSINITKSLSRQANYRRRVIARLKPGLTLEAARADLSVLLERTRKTYPQWYSRAVVRVIGLSESLVGDVRLALLILFGAVAFVLLIACANVANLLLARSASRQKEMAIRAAIGAGRLRLVRQMLTESLLLSAIGGGAGLLLAHWEIKLLVVMSPDWIARIEESGVDGRVLGFTCMIVALVGLIAGIIPALQASKVDVNEALQAQSSATGASSRQSGRLRALPALMIAELALSLVLLVGAGLMIKSFLRLMAVPKGFNPDGVLTLPLMPSPLKYPMSSPQRGAYFHEGLARIQKLPGIEAASLTSFLPLTELNFSITIGFDNRRFIERQPPLEVGEGQSIAITHISPDYFRTMSIQLRTGRPFTAQDDIRSPKVAIINETLARRFFTNENPIGHRLFIDSHRPTIVGVVGDTRHLGLDQGVQPEVYLPYLQDSDLDRFLTLAVKVSSGQNNPTGLSSLAGAIRNQAQAIDPNEPVHRVVTMDERLSNSVAERRFQMLLLGVFAAVALFIATIGIYGVIFYAVSQRTHEIGVRMALGAQPGDVLRMVLWRGMSLTLIGVSLGLAAAFALTRVLKNLLFEVSTTDPSTFASIALLLVVVALIASYIPVRRATKVDPLQALRHE